MAFENDGAAVPGTGSTSDRPCRKTRLPLKIAQSTLVMLAVAALAAFTATGSAPREVMANMALRMEPAVHGYADVEGRRIDLSALDAPDAVSCSWYGDHLETDDEKALYEAIDAATMALDKMVAVDGDLDSEGVSRCFWAVVYDNPEYFWLEKNYRYWYDGDEDIYKMELSFSESDKAEIEEKLSRYCLMADAVISGSESPHSEGQKMHAIYDWVINNTSYEGGERDQDLSSVFDGRRSVCAGYTCALQFMAQRAGIPCIRIGGHRVPGEDEADIDDGGQRPHTWVAAAVFGQLAYYDVTWDDAVGATREDRYYAMSQEACEENHVFESDVAPRCGGVRDDSAEAVRGAVRRATGQHLDPSVYEIGPDDFILPFS